MPYSSLWQYEAIFFLGDSIRPVAAFHRLDGSNYCTDLFYRHGIRLQRVCFLVARELMLSDLIVVKPGLHVFLNMNELIVKYTWRFLWILTRVLNLILSWFPITENTFITNWFSGFWHLILRMGYIEGLFFICVCAFTKGYMSTFVYKKWNQFELSLSVYLYACTYLYMYTY